MSKKNVLVAGIGQTNYILQLYKNISPRLKGFKFQSINLEGFGNQNSDGEAENIFNENYFYKPDLKNAWLLLKAFHPIITNSYFWKDLKIFFAENGSIFSNKGLRLILRHINAFYYARFIDTRTVTDVIHLHFPRHIFALFLKYLKNDYQIIISYWGSDIYRINSWKDYEIQNSSLNNVDHITVTTPEMEFAVLSRFGFNLKEKIKKARFIHNNQFYKMADLFMGNKNWESKYKEILGIEPNKIMILFGHNAHRENNHQKFLQCLSEVPSDILNEFHIVFPFSYGDKTGEYEIELKKKSDKIDCEFTYLTHFIEWEEMAKLKIISDVYIHCPTTDGLSAFLTEFFYTNNLAVVGDWLPYKTFEDFKIEYVKFQDFKNLKEILIQLRELIHNKSKLVNKNHDIIRRNFSIDKISAEWISVFKELS